MYFFPNTILQKDFCVLSNIYLFSFVGDDDKSHVIVFANKTQSSKRMDVCLRAGKFVIQPSKTELLLGANICQDLKWKEHIMDNKRSLLNQLTSRLNGLQLISRKAPFKTRLMVANGIYISALIYIIQLWGEKQDFLIKALQVSQNKAARFTTKLSWFTPTRILMKQCNWLSVRQLVCYHTILTIHKTIKSRVPKYFFNKITSENTQNTRQSVKFDDKFPGKTERTQASFCYRRAQFYNKLPIDIRTATSIQIFKRETRQWVLNNVPVE